VGIEGTRNITLNPGTVQAVTQRDWGPNKTFSFSVDGTPLQARRQVVSIDNCNKCHGTLLVHGNNRSSIEQCVLCHNPNDSDAAMRPVSAGAPETVDFRTMIHKIHTGNELTRDFTIYGYGGSKNNFNGVTFPGDRRDCAKCHVNESEDLPLSPNLLPVVTPRDYLNPTQPETAACLACHTDKATASHALANTTTLGESCDVCHGSDGEFSVDKVHAR
jgi:OmcA/MtrC family decaheme c-type cytochrome